MMKRHTPPGLNWNSCVVIENPRGPHQFARCFASLHIWNTRSGGASKTRVAEIARASSLVAAAVAFLGGMILLLFLNFSKVFVQTVGTLFPELFVVAHPVGDVLERTGIETAGSPLRIAASSDEPGALEHFEVLGDRRQAHVERLRQLVDGH